MTNMWNMNLIHWNNWQEYSNTSLLEAPEWVLTVTTDEYKAQVIPDEVVNKLFNSDQLTGWIVDLLNWSSPKNNQLKQLNKVAYPNWLWSIRYEALTSIWYQDKDGGTFYLNRLRPDLAQTNTPWAEEPWIIFHGIDNGQVLSFRRFVADILGKKQDSDVSPQDIASFHPSIKDIFAWFELQLLWHILLTNWNKAREQEAPMSWLLQANLILLNQEQVEDIIWRNEGDWNNNYRLRSAIGTNKLTHTENWNHTPKLEAYRELLRKNFTT